MNAAPQQKPKTREDRVADALRENLRKRKAQSRLREAGIPSEPQSSRARIDTQVQSRAADSKPAEDQKQCP